MQKNTSQTVPHSMEDAQIHLRIPAAMKGRWVAESRKRGMKLTDWIIDRVEGSKMHAYKVPESLASKYHGAGHALAATINNQLIDIVYMADVLPDFDGQHVAARLDDALLGPTVRRLQALGEVHAGMLSCWEFVPL